MDGHMLCTSTGRRRDAVQGERSGMGEIREQAVVTSKGGYHIAGIICDWVRGHAR